MDNQPEWSKINMKLNKKETRTEMQKRRYL